MLSFAESTYNFKMIPSSYLIHALLSNMHSQLCLCALFPKRHCRFRNVGRIQRLVLRCHSTLDRNQSNLHTTLTECTVETLHHVALSCLVHRQGQESWGRIPWEMAVGDQQSRLGRRIGLGQGLKLRNVVLSHDIQRESGCLMKRQAVFLIRGTM
jgi:hypothetical protein